MAQSTLSPDLLRLIAERFKVLSEPARLEILNALREGEMSVSELVDATGLGQANLSKHLQLLLAHNFVARRKDARRHALVAVAAAPPGRRAADCGAGRSAAGP